MNYWERQKIAYEKKLAVSNSRLDYCIDIYRQEIRRRESLEKKSQFYLSFVTLLLSGIFIRLQTIEDIDLLLDSSSTPPQFLFATTIFLIGLGVSILLCLIAVFESIRVENYIGPAKEDMTFDLFGPKSNNTDELKTTDNTARMYSLAAEKSKRINNRKAIWLKFTSLLLFTAILCLMALIGTITYLSLIN